MRLIRGLLVLLVIVAAIFVGVGLMLPGTIHVERTTVIAAGPDQIFPFLNDLRKFNAWSPWAQRDPATRYDFTGPEQGAGASMAWNSEKLGTGSQHIVDSVPGERVVTRLEFGQMGSAQARFSLQAEGAVTRVTWGFDSDLPRNPLARWFGLMFPSWIGTDYEEGLARLKCLVESGAA